MHRQKATRRTLLAGLAASLFTAATARAQVKNWPPVPTWKPSFRQPVERIVDRFHYYMDGKQSFAVFRNGTCAVVPHDLSNKDAARTATEMLSKIINYHPDMTPLKMDDGNIMVEYREPAYSVVLTDFAKAHWREIDARHKDALTPTEVLITPLGPNEFDDFGKMALWGRCYMFMDAQRPRVLRIERAKV